MSSGNSGGAVEIKPEHGGTLKPWQPGVSGNPRGRAKGIARAVRDRCNGDPSELVDILLTMARDETLRPADRTNATRALIEHGWGKAPAFASIEGADPLELDEVTEAIASLVDELARKRAA